MAGVTARQVSSKSRMVALSILPARSMPATALWIASKASLLNLRVAVIANFHPFLGFQFLLDLDIRLPGVEIGQFAKRPQFVLVEPGGLEGPHGFLGMGHGRNVALSAIYRKAAPGRG